MAVQVTAIVVIAADEAAGFLEIDEAQSGIGMAAHDIFDVGARFGDVTSFVAQVQQPGLILRVDVVGTDQPVEMLAGLVAERALTSRMS